MAIVGPSAAALSGAQNSNFPQRKSAPNRYPSNGGNQHTLDQVGIFHHPPDSWVVSEQAPSSHTEKKHIFISD